MALPAVVIVLAAILATATVALDQMRCTDAAREAARAAARNEPAATVAAVARAEGPPGAEVHVSRVGDRVVVTVSAGVRVRLLGTETIRVSSRAVAVREPVGVLGGRAASTVVRGEDAAPAPDRGRAGVGSHGDDRAGIRARLGGHAAPRRPAPGSWCAGVGPRAGDP